MRTERQEMSARSGDAHAQPIGGVVLIDVHVLSLCTLGSAG
ncbi:hypothetical protein ACQHIV_03740 [Kribbella sp. GL6]